MKKLILTDSAKNRTVPSGTVPALLFLLALLFLGQSSALQAASLNRTSAEVKAGNPVFLELNDSSGEEIEWSVSRYGGVIYCLTKDGVSAGAAGQTRTVNGSPFTVYGISEEGVLTTRKGVNVKMMVVPYDDCTVSVSQEDPDDPYEIYSSILKCSVSVQKQNITGADVLGIKNYGIHNPHDLRLRYRCTYADGNHAPLYGSISITIKNDDGTVVFQDTKHVYHHLAEEDADEFDQKGGIGVIALNESGDEIEEGFRSAGTATIEVRPSSGSGGFTKSIRVEGLPQNHYATQIQMPKTARIWVNERKTLNVKTVIAGEKPDGLSWTTSDSNIVSIDEDGEMYGEKKGKCKITCTLANGKKYVCNVTCPGWKHTSKELKSYTSVDNLEYGSHSIKVFTYDDVTVTIKIKGKKLKVRQDGYYYTAKVPGYYKIGTKFKVTVSNGVYKANLTGKVVKNPAATYEFWDLLQNQKRLKCKVTNASKGDYLKVTVGGRSYKKIIKKDTSGSTFYMNVSPAKAGTKMTVCLYNKFGQKLDKVYHDIVYAGDTVYVGMTKAQVALLSFWHSPDKINSSAYSEQWCYDSNNDGRTDAYLYFRNGVVSNWQING